MPIVAIVEAKKDDFDQGQAQLYVQLEAVHQVNVKSRNGTHNLWGVITNARIWIFVCFLPTNRAFIESKWHIIQDSDDTEAIKNILSILCCILLQQYTDFDSDFSKL